MSEFSVIGSCLQWILDVQSSFYCGTEENLITYRFWMKFCRLFESKLICLLLSPQEVEVALSRIYMCFLFVICLITWRTHLSCTCSLGPPRMYLMLFSPLSAAACSGGSCYLIRSVADLWEQQGGREGGRMKETFVSSHIARRERPSVWRAYRSLISLFLFVSWKNLID